MNYCENCHILCREHDAVCPTCQGEVRPPEPDDAILLVSDREYETIPLCTALSEANIAFAQSRAYASALSAKSRGFGNICSILVPYENYDEAKAIAKSQGFRFGDDVTVKPLDDTARASAKPQPSPEAGRKSAAPPETEEISPTKQKLGKLLLFLSVIAAIVVVVFLSDSIIGFVKGLFG